MWGPRVLAAVMAVAAFGCAKTNPFACTDSSQCVLGGELGMCEPHGFCSFADPTCAGGWRFEPNAGNSLGGTCTDQAAPIDAAFDAPAPCGAIGQTCCSGEPACVDGASCQSGTCQPCVQDLALGHRFSCFLKAGGTVWCAGVNGDGQLGRLDPMPSATPLQISDDVGPIMDATAVAAGHETACAIRTGGAVWCWGDGSDGQIGNGNSVDTELARRVILDGGLPLVGIVAIEGGFDHTCARSAAGEVWCWGRNTGGQLGDGTVLPANRAVAAPVLEAPGGAPVTGVSEIALGGGQTCALRAGELWCWGQNGNHELGDDTSTSRPSPILVGPATAVSTGIYHTCFVRPDATVACMGANWHGTIGIGIGGDFNGSDATTPQSVLTAVDGAPLAGAAKVGSGGAMACALLLNGRVMCWGDNKHGQIGSGTSSNVPATVLRRTATGAEIFDDADRLVVGWVRACARRTNGEWWCWGRGRDGEFGDNTFTSRGIASPLAAGLTCP